MLKLDDYFYKNYPALTHCFIKGAPGYLIKNLKPSLGLANGTKAIYEAIVLDERDDPVTISQRLVNEISSDIVLKHPPHYIIVSILQADPSLFNKMIIIEGQVIIPIGIVKRRKDIAVKTTREAKQFKICYNPHNIEPGFAVTVHKIQDQTVDNVIIDLNFRPFQTQFDFHSLIVSLSQMRNSNNIRILPRQSAALLSIICCT